MIVNSSICLSIFFWKLHLFFIFWWADLSHILLENVPVLYLLMGWPQSCTSAKCTCSLPSDGLTSVMYFWKMYLFFIFWWVDLSHVFLPLSQYSSKCLLSSYISFLEKTHIVSTPFALLHNAQNYILKFESLYSYYASLYLCLKHSRSKPCITIGIWFSCQ